MHAMHPQSLSAQSVHTRQHNAAFFNFQGYCATSLLQQLEENAALVTYDSHMSLTVSGSSSCTDECYTFVQN